MAVSVWVTLMLKATTLSPLVALKRYSPALLNAIVELRPEVLIVAVPPLGAETCCQIATAELVSVNCLADVFVVLSAASLVEPD